MSTLYGKGVLETLEGWRYVSPTPDTRTGKQMGRQEFCEHDMHMAALPARMNVLHGSMSTMRSWCNVLEALWHT